MSVRFFGYKTGEDADSPSELQEVTIVGSPAELRNAAEFLLQAAKAMEAHGSDFGHEHLSDFNSSLVDEPDLIVCADPDRSWRDPASPEG